VDLDVHAHNDDREGTPPRYASMALYGPGGRAESVLTVMLPGEE
jgi:hypothetical protein